MTIPDTLPKISIVIPAYNEEKTVRDCLNSVRSLDYPRELLKVIIVDDGSTDSTPKLLDDYPDFAVIKGGHKGPSAARNTAVKTAEGDFVAFTDADCILPANWLKALLQEFISDDVAAVGGAQTPPAGESEFGRAVSRVLEALSFVGGYSRTHKAPRDVDHNALCNVIYRKRVLEELGGFDESLWPGEDVEFDHRVRKAGFRVRYNPNAVVEHYRPGSLKQYNRTMFKYGWAQAYLVKKFGMFRTMHLVPFLSLLFFVAFLFLLFLVAGDVGPLISLALFGVVFLFLLALFGSMRGLGGDPLNYLLLLTTFFMWNFGFFSFLLRGKRV